MEKELLLKRQLILSLDGLKKYETDVKNIYIYEAVEGMGFEKIIFDLQKNKDSGFFKQRSIVIVWTNYIDIEEGFFFGEIVNVKYYSNIRSKYYVIEDLKYNK